MKKQVLSLCLFTIATIGTSQTWTKISGRADSTQVKSLASINGRVIIAGQNWFSNTVTDYLTSTDGNVWNRIPTFSYASPIVWSLSQNNLLLTTGFISTKTYSSNTWANFNNNGIGYAEFSNGTIICGSYSAAQTLSMVATNGVIGAATGASFKLGSRYCNGANNRLFMFSYSGGLGYIDYANINTVMIPTTLDGNSMTATAWQGYNIVDMVKTTNGNLFAADALNHGMLKSTDNGVTWTTSTQFSVTTSVLNIVKNSLDHLFILGYDNTALKIWKSTDYGVSFTDISGNLPYPQGRTALYINASDELFSVVNGNNYQPTVSGIYKFGSTSGIKESTHELTIVTISPNPSNAVFNITNNTVIDNITVTNLQGSVVLNKNSNALNTSIDLTEFSNGIYFLQITSGNNTTFKKIVKN